LIFLAVPFSSSSAVGDPLSPDGAIRLDAFDRIHLPAEPLAAERSMAGVLQTHLLGLYDVELTITSGPPEKNQPAILIGRRMAVAAGAITEEELESVKYDGYVIKCSTDCIALAGYAPQGTIYATYALLKQLGLRLYPWRNAGAVVVRQPLEDGKVAPFTIASKPFFLRRDLLGHLDQGRWGTSLREYSLGEFRFVHEHEYFKGKGWLGGDHTAPYLVPMGKYYDSHPEYFAMKGGERIPKDTQNARVALCLSNPDVHRIAADRAIEWMGIQHERRFFHVTDGDTSECQCPQCLAIDPKPRSCTDRYLKWVNSVARAVGKKYPDNVVLALAYAGSTQPPANVKPESNVSVMYCPWYWDSRTTSAVSWASPLNITAMKEYMAWTMMFPDQMSLYDYPGAWVYGQADRLKFLAKNNARVFYSCGGRGDLFQWVNANLLWDPLLNTEELVTEFVDAYYGPASEPMRRYQQLRLEAIEKNLKHTRFPFRDAEFLRETRELSQRAIDLASEADAPTRARILAGALESIRLVLQNTHPEKSDPELRSTAAQYIQDVDRYIGLSKRLHEVYEELGNRYVVRTHKGDFQKAIEALGVDLQLDENAAAADENIFDHAIASLGDLRNELDKSEQRSARVSDPAVAITTTFDADDEAANWLSDGSQADLISPPEKTTIDCLCGETHTGVGIQAPLAKLPVIPHHNITIHAGRFYAERVFDPPVDATGCFYLDFHIRASCAVPITVYINQVHSDIDLHAGEQIVRVDMRNFDRAGRFTYAEWDKQVRRISFDIWPQDNYYPYPKVQNAEIVFLGMTATNGKPIPANLPHKGKAIWLSQFRPNIGRGVAVSRDMYDQYMQRQHYKHVGMDYGSRWMSEGFRTFTEHRAVSPIFAILTGPNPTVREQEMAGTLQGYLEEMFAVRLAVNPNGPNVGECTGNVILLGREACLAAGRIDEKELRHVGPQGLAINAHNGRIAIAGPDDDGTVDGVIRYLEDHGVLFYEPSRIHVPDLSADLLHELYVLDWPYFRERTVRMDWRAGNEAKAPLAADSDSLAAARDLASAIKDVARSGSRELPSSISTEAKQSPLSRHVAAKLMWDPFADATRLIREFSERR